MSQPPVIYQVSDLSNEMRRLMETSYPEIWIEGELSSLSAPASGHFYFSLKDEQSQLRCAMFRNKASISRYRPKAGDLVRVRAKISVYTARGDLQCIVQHIEEAGEGILQRRFEELKRALNNEGLFDQSSKQAMPGFAKHIGVITSPTGAAIKDIISTLKRRAPGIPITVYPAVVQGESAAKSIISAIENAQQHASCDVLILSRGGGSLEDLWCFNDENLARVIHNCSVPIISGVGHEVDITIADLVADMRAPTPTAAAEMLSPDTAQLLAHLQSLHFRLPRSIDRVIQRLSQNVDMTSRQLTHPKQQLRTNQERLNTAGARMQRAIASTTKFQSSKLLYQQKHFQTQTPVKRLRRLTGQTSNLGLRLTRAQQQFLGMTNTRFASLGEQLHLVSPIATLDRGFSIARNHQGQILRAAGDARIDEDVSVRLRSGTLLCAVKGVE